MRWMDIGLRKQRIVHAAGRAIRQGRARPSSHTPKKAASSKLRAKNPGNTLKMQTAMKEMAQ